MLYTHAHTDAANIFVMSPNLKIKCGEDNDYKRENEI